jgi:hypothetical protein
MFFFINHLKDLKINLIPQMSSLILMMYIEIEQGGGYGTKN